MPVLIPRTAASWAILALFAFFSLRRFLLPTLPFDPNAHPVFPDRIAESLGTYSGHRNTTASSSSSSSSHTGKSLASSPAQTYFDQVFSLTGPQEPYSFPALRKQCAHTTWRRDDANSTGPIYLRCEGIYLGLTSVISQVKSCFKMAIEAGVGVILPDIPLRAADNLLWYNQGNHDAERPFGAWFDEEHLVASMLGACPGLDITTPRDVTEGRGEVVNDWSVDIHSARFFRERDGYFWAGKPFSAFFEDSLLRLRQEHDDDDDERKAEEKNPEEPMTEEHKAEEDKKAEASTTKDDGTSPDPQQLVRRTSTSAATVIGMRADFELFSATHDPTGHERLLWDDLGRTLRFLAEPRAIVDKMLRQLGAAGDDENKQQQQQPPPVFFAVHFRGEGDNMWTEPAEQMRVDLDALDAAWEMYRHDEGVAQRGEGGAEKKPPVYLACGDEGSLAAFTAAGAARGWNVTSKYALAHSMETSETFEMIEKLPFDFQAIVDLGLLVRSYFFIGLMGSAFSYTAANLRDPTTRYRGSSFEVWDDGGARTHLFPNIDKYGDTTMEKYACCL